MTGKIRILPPDISPSWLNVIRRIKSVTQGQAVLVTLNVFVDEYGVPRIWTKPTVSRVEPVADAGESLDALESEVMSLTDT